MSSFTAAKLGFSQMCHLRDRIVFESGLERVRGADASILDIVDLLESSKTPLQVTTGLGIEISDLVAALAFFALGAEGSPGLTLERQEPPRPELLDSLREASIAILYPRTPRAARLSLSAGLLQVFDFWDESHAAAQEADDLGDRGSAAYWHGIAHRREPDSGNAVYWFRRVGKHPIFAALAGEARALAEGATAAWPEQVLAGGSWSPIAFVHACEHISPGSPEATLARRLQRLEMWLLLEHSLLQM